MFLKVFLFILVAVIASNAEQPKKSSSIYSTYQPISFHQNRGYSNYYDDYYNRYNPIYTRNENNNYNLGYITRYNPRTGTYERVLYNAYDPYYNYNNYNSNYQNRYNSQTGRYEKVYYPHGEVGKRNGNDYYGKGSVQSVHVPRINYNNEGHWKILKDNRQSNNDNYHYSYETENGIRVAEDSYQLNRDTTKQSSRKSGFYEYVGDDGKTYRVDWIADENGFRASGAHLPQQIQRSLDKNAKK